MDTTPTTSRANRNDPRITPLTVPNRRSRTNPAAADASRMLRTIATLIEQTSDNPYRVAAYRRAAAALAESDHDLHELLVLGKHGVELDLPGLGERMRRKLGDLLTTGQMGFTVELRPTLPPQARSLLVVRSIGPRTALRLVSELGLSSVADVAAAARRGHIRRLHGFGVRRERQLLREAEAVLGSGKQAAITPATDAASPAVQPEPPRPIRPPASAQLPLRDAA